MFFHYQQEVDDGVKIGSTSETHLQDAVRQFSIEAGFPLVSTYEYDETSTPDTLVVSSVADLGDGKRLDDRHVTQYRTPVQIRETATAEEVEMLDAPFFPSPDDEGFTMYEVTLPAYADVTAALHSNDATVTTPISDEDARNTVVSHHQDILINYDVLLSQSLYGDFYDGSDDDYQNMYQNVSEFDATLADVVFTDPEIAKTQIDAASASHANSWRGLFTIPYSFYKQVMFEAYYADTYSLSRSHQYMMWAQTELYDGPVDLAQCRGCGCVRSSARLEDGLCAEKDDCTALF